MTAAEAEARVDAALRVVKIARAAAMKSRSAKRIALFQEAEAAWLAALADLDAAQQAEEAARRTARREARAAALEARNADQPTLF